MDNTDTPHTHIDITTEAGQSRLGYRVTGSGPDLVFVHGWPLNRETWRGMAASLPDFRCHLIDLPGCGQSITPADVPVSLAGHIDAVSAAIDALGLTAATVVGQDSGGLVARNVAARRPDVVNAIVVFGTEIPGKHPQLIDQLQVALKVPGAKATTRTMLGNAKACRSPQLLGGLFWDRDLIEGSFRAEVLTPMLEDKTVFDRQIEILYSYKHDIVDELASVHPKIACPTLLVWGEHDPFFPVDDARAMCGQFGGPTTFEVIQSARLLVYEEHPERAAALTRSFLQSHQLAEA